MTYRLVISLCLYLLSNMSVAFAQSTPLIFHSNHYPLLNNQEQTGFLDQLTKAILKPHGFEVNISFLPPERAFTNLNRYLANGNVAKIAGLKEIYPNVRQIPGKMIEMKFVAFTLRNNPDVKNWQDLFNYNVGIVTGMKIVERNLVNHPHLTRVVTPYQLFQLLVMGRVDYVVFSYWNGLAYAKRLNLQDQIHTAQPPLAVKDMFMYMNDRYEALIPKLAETLANLKADGTYQRLFEQTLVPLQQ